MKIVNVESYRMHVPIKGDYRMATGVHTALESLLVRITTDEGVTGVGEAHQGIAGYTPETLDTMHTLASKVYGPALIGQTVETVEVMHEYLTSVRRGNPFTRSAIETAVFDAIARKRGLRIADVLGGPVRDRLELSGGIGIEEPEVVGEKVSALVEQGYRTIKVKIGTGDIAKDIARVREARKAVGDGIAIRVDANSGYQLSDALTVVRGIADLNVEHLEQPVPGENIDGMVHLRRLGAVPLMADESVVTPEDAYRFVKAGAGDAVKVKITKVGGYINARRIVDICQAAGVKVVIGQGLCSSLEACAEAQLACAFTHVHPVGEMVGPAKLADDLSETPADLSKGVLKLPDGPGIGIDLSEAKLRKYALDGHAEAARTTECV